MAYGRGNVSFGRTVIYTGAKTIDDGNICDELAAALSVHAVNRNEIQYLYDYRRGKQPILGRTCLLYTSSSETSLIIKKAKDFLKTFDAKLVITGKMNFLAYCFRAKNYYGMADKSEVVLTPNNPLGGARDTKALEAQYIERDVYKRQPQRKPGRRTVHFRL